MKFKAYPRHRIKFSISSLVSFFFADRTKNYGEEFINDFLKLTNARFALLLPSCRYGVYHAMDFYKREAEIIALSGSTFSAMKACAESFTESARPLVLIENGARPVEKKKALFLYSHLFFQHEITDLSSQHTNLIEDCAHCPVSDFTAKPFTLSGDCAVFSFGIGKSLNTLNGGILLTNDENLYESLKIKCQTQIYVPPRQYFGAIKIWLMSLLTDTFLFSVVTFPILKLLSLLDLNFLDDSLNENVGRADLQRQIQNASQYNNFQAYLGLRQIKEMTTEKKKKDQVVDLFLKRLRPVFHPYYQKPFTYLVIPFKDRDAIRKKLLWQNIDTKISDMDCYLPKDHPDFLFNASLLEVPFSEDFSDADVEYLSNVLNQYEDFVIKADSLIH